MSIVWTAIWNTKLFNNTHLTKNTKLGICTNWKKLKISIENDILRKVWKIVSD